MDLDEVADELYGLVPSQFVQRRTELEKQARSDGDRELAATIKALTRPTVVAWAANQLVRERLDEVQGLIDVGTALRRASARLGGDELRELSTQVSRLVHALVLRAKTIGGRAGVRVGQDAERGLEATLRAALADPDAADALIGGRLVEGLERWGFDGVGSEQARPAAPAPARPAEPAPGVASLDRARADRERRRAEQLAEAQGELAGAQEELTSAQAREAEVQTTAAEAASVLEERRNAEAAVRDELARAVQERESAERAAADADQERAAARSRAARAQHRVDAAGREVAKLTR